MRNFRRLLPCFITALLFLCFLALPGCDTFERPVSKMSQKKIDLFSNTDLNNAGLIPANLVLNMDYGGYMEYYIKDAVISEQKNNITAAVDEVNKDAFSEGDYQAGYRVLYVRDKNITQSGTTVVVRVEFVNINHLDGGVKAQTLEEYLQTNTDSQENNNFTDIKTGGASSIVTIQDKQKTYVVTYGGTLIQVPVTVNGARITSYNSVGYLTSDTDTISFSTGNSVFVYVENELPLWLIWGTCILGALFAIVLTVKIIMSRRNR